MQNWIQTLSLDKKTRIMKKLFILSVCAFIVVSCGGNTEESTTNNEDGVSVDTTAADSLTVDTLVLEEDPTRINIDVAALLNKAEETFELPFSVDSTFISDLSEEGDSESNLTNAEAQYLNHTWAERNGIGMDSYDVNIFIDLDSLKIKGEYEEYQETIDIGMARYSNANVIGKVVVDETLTMLIWSTDYATYEACPYGYGTCVFGTLFNKNIGLNTIVLGEISGGGDAPYWGGTAVTSKIKEGYVYYHKVEESGGDEDPETGEELIEHSEEDAVFGISAENGFYESK
jgi:hypothetical protein